MCDPEAGICVYFVIPKGLAKEDCSIDLLQVFQVILFKLKINILIMARAEIKQECDCAA